MDEFDELLADEDEKAQNTTPAAKAATSKETAKVTAKAKSKAKTGGAKAKTTAKTKATTKAKYVRENGVIPTSKRNLKLGTVLVYSGKYGDHKLKVVAPNKAQKEKGYERVYKLDSKTVFTSPTLASNHVQGVEHSNGWAFWKLPA